MVKNENVGEMTRQIQQSKNNRIYTNPRYMYKEYTDKVSGQSNVQV